VAASAQAHGLVGALVRVHNPGGPLDVELDESVVVLGGPAQKVGDVTVDEAVLAVLAASLRVPGPALSGPDDGALSGAAPDSTATEVAARP
jgi:hypothetical protein